ncbi:MAG: hypothetical protein ACP6IY_14205 [Promethearchaeia archaeon]
MDEPAELFITDDFSAYKGAMTGLKRNVIHVRHIHQPPYGRIVIDEIEVNEREIVTTIVYPYGYNERYLIGD